MHSSYAQLMQATAPTNDSFYQEHAPIQLRQLH